MTILKPHHLKWLEIDWPSVLDIAPVSRASIRDHARDANRWYVYILWRDDLGSPVPFYVGKGTNRRVTQHTSPSDRTNRYKAVLLSKLIRTGSPERYSIVASFSDEQDALNLEMELIATIGRADLKDGPLTNRTDGGDGTRGHLAKSRGESPSARAVVAGRIGYDCLEDAAEVLKITGGALSQRIANGWPGYYYADEGQRPEKDGVLGRYHRAVCVPGGSYSTMTEAALETGESVRSIWKRIRAGWKNYYYSEEGQRPRKTNDKPCSIDGEFFPNQTLAANAKSISKGGLAKRLRSRNYSDWIDLSGTIKKEPKRYKDAPIRVSRIWIDDVEYESAIQASLALNIKDSTILFRLRSSNFPTFVGEGIKKAERSVALAKAAVALTVAGRPYETLSEASRAIGVDINTIKKRCKSPAFPQYSSDDQSLKVVAPKDNRPSLIRISIGAQTYRSINAAFEATGEARSQIKQRLDDPNFPSYRRSG
jgi:hypothetical protein